MNKITNKNKQTDWFQLLTSRTAAATTVAKWCSVFFFVLFVRRQSVAHKTEKNKHKKTQQNQNTGILTSVLHWNIRTHGSKSINFTHTFTLGWLCSHTKHLLNCTLVQMLFMQSFYLLLLTTTTKPRTMRIFHPLAFCDCGLFLRMHVWFHRISASAFSIGFQSYNVRVYVYVCDSIVYCGLYAFIRAYTLCVNWHC